MTTTKTHSIRRAWLAEPIDTGTPLPKPTRARLAKGLCVTFTFRPDGVSVAWEPERPSPMPRQIQRRYVEARDRAYQAFAAYLGGPVAVLGSGSDQVGPIMSVIHPSGRVEKQTLEGQGVH